MTPADGSTPPGAADERQAARLVRDMFGRVAGRYDFLNHFLSLNIDRYWRARTSRRLKPYLTRPSARIMDACCGTGDLLLSFEGAGAGRVIGSDFCHPMLISARRKLARRGSRSPLIEADALRLPLPDASLDLIAMAFGFRNLSNYDRGLEEMRRVLRPGGVAAILEFSRPRNALFGALYHLYSRRVLPTIGGAISGDTGAYRYLPESVRRFPSPEDLAESMHRAGFSEVRFERMTGGIAVLHIATAAQ